MANHANIKGLPLILGGEIRAVSKLADRAESTVILIRGSAGSGKTIFATQLAAHEALVRGGDVVYCCIELLPSELDAQISGLTFGPEHRMLRVGNLPMGAPVAPELAPRIFASIIDVPEDALPDIGVELQRVLGGATRDGLVPKVVVIDSLAEGYRLGTSVPRALADAVAKFAADEGIVLVLLEEVVDGADSIWTFVADVVLDLAHHGATGTSAAEQRAITVRKNRFGPAHVGPHAFAIHRAGGIEIYPRLGAYFSETARTLLPQNIRQGNSRSLWSVTPKTSGGKSLLPKVGEVVLVTGDDATAVAVALARLVSGTESLRLDMAGVAPSEDKVLRCGDPILGPEQLLAQLCFKLGELSGRISGLVVGDLEAINHNIDPDGLRRALPVLIMIAHSADLPVVLFETTSQHGPLSNHLADITIRVRVAPHPLASPQIVAHLDCPRRGLVDLEVDLPQ
jgi:KaiC/GvpD/RAD55 family RecA-like ATPase